ncbi:MAG: DNA mismatch repair endonuclease MutL [Spirochaetia bacterium]|nr:DNA mismatch repair endonuclease MutL [Spirochaetia bacterium]
MGNIRVLPDTVANQIAAGEVVVRPAAVVKELLENAFDAGAKNVAVNIEKAGKQLIEVRDDGEGMDPADLKPAFLRHATSKIRFIEDLTAIQTYGFRGEALASIAAVSRVTAVTRNAQSRTGAMIVIEAGRTVREGEKAANRGTDIAVRDLFYNTPARLKFMKSDRTEDARIIETVTAAGLSRSGVSVRLFIDSSEVLFFPAEAPLKERVRIVSGSEVCNALVELKNFSDNIKVTGFAAKPAVSRSDRNGQYLFVNGRPVTSRNISYAVFEGYGTRLMKGRYPYTYVFIDVNPSFVDVNVHPAKAEVKFREERDIFNAVKKAVDEALGAVDLAVAPQAPGIIDVFEAPAGARIEEARESIKQAVHNFYVNETPSMFTGPSVQMSRDRVKTAKAGADREYMWLNVLGQIHKTYITGEDDGSLVLIDQHAAHEKVLYESIMDGINSGGLKIQELLIPEILELNPAEARIAQESQAVFAKLGFTVEKFGTREFKISSHPVILRGRPAAPFVREMAALLSEKGKAGADEVLKGLTSTMACRAAVKAGDVLKTDEIASLLESYMKLKDPYSCPHGRPSMIKISFEEIEKMFKRKL